MKLFFAVRENEEPNRNPNFDIKTGRAFLLGNCLIKIAS